MDGVEKLEEAGYKGPENRDDGKKRVASTILVAILIGAMWLIVFTSRWLRNWRASVALALGSAAIVLAGTLPGPFAALLQGALWVGVTTLILTRGEALSAVGEPSTPSSKLTWGC